MTKFALVAIATLHILSWGLISKAANAVGGSNAVNYGDLEAVAKAAITREVLQLNEVVKQVSSRNIESDEPTLLKGYKNSDLKIFRMSRKFDGMDPAFLFDICILTSDTVDAVTGTQFTKKNLFVNANLNAAKSAKSAVDGKLFGVIESACLNAKKRFVKRLSDIAIINQPWTFNETTVKNISSVVFFPADYAKPRLAKTLFKVLPYVIEGSLIAAAACSIVGLPVSLWLYIDVMSEASFGIKTLLPGAKEIIQQKKMSDIGMTNGIRLDLNENEKAFQTGN